MTCAKPVIRWGVLWHSKNRLDGVTEHLMCQEFVPVLFRTRRAARAWITSNSGYIAHRTDLRSEPFGWRLPKAVRVKVEIVQ